MNLLIGAATVGLILAPLALGVFISYRLYRTLDLTADGSFGVGAALTAALLVQQVPPIAATALGAWREPRPAPSPASSTRGSW